MDLYELHHSPLADAANLLLVVISCFTQGYNISITYDFKTMDG